MQNANSICPRCHEENALNARFCIECGYDLQVAPETIMLKNHANQTPPTPYQANTSPQPSNTPPANHLPPLTHYTPSQSNYRTPQYQIYSNTNLSSEERTWASFCHLASLIGWIIPLGDLLAAAIIWLTKRDSSAFIDDQGKEALNYQISFYLYTLIAVILSCVYIGLFMLAALMIFDLIICIIAASKASQGIRYRYPGTIRFIK